MYYDFFGFSKTPFNLTPDLHFLYVTESIQEAIASLIYGISGRKGFITVSGEVGTGKTTLLIYLLTVLDPKIKPVFICQTRVTFEELLKEILTELNLPVGDERKSSMTRQLHGYLRQTLDRGENVVILIDEAQTLSKEALEELRMLSNLETSEAKLLQIALVGQPELENKLNSEDLRQLKQRIGIRKKLRPITEEESRKYIEHRLNRVGSSSSAVFTPEALSLICKHSEGIFRNINIICYNALLIGYALQRKRIDAAVIQEVLGDMGISLPKKQARPEIISSPKPMPKEISEESLLADQGEMFPSRRPLSRRALYLLLGTVGLVGIFFIGLEYFKGFLKPSAPKYSINPPIIAQKAAPAISDIKTESSQTPPPKLVNEEKRDALKSAPRGIATPAPQVKPAFSPLKTAAKDESRPKRIVTVARGDTLSSLSLRYYKQANTTLVDHIWEFNPKIENIHLLRVNQKIQIPEIKEDSFLVESSTGGYKVHLATFDYPESAARYQNEPPLRGKNIETIPRKVSPEETWYRLVAGKFETKEEALKTPQTLKEAGLLPGYK